MTASRPLVGLNPEREGWHVDLGRYRVPAPAMWGVAGMLCYVAVFDWRAPSQRQDLGSCPLLRSGTMNYAVRELTGGLLATTETKKKPVGENVTISQHRSTRS